MEKLPSTPEMDARQAEEIANSMMLNSPLPDAERSDERLPEGGGSDKLPKEGGDFIMPCTDRVLSLCFSSRFPKSREYCGKS